MKERMAANPRRVLVTVVALFALPVILAWLLANGVLGWLPAGRVNYGTLILPPPGLNDLKPLGEHGERVSLARPYGQWSLAVLTSGACGASCRDALDRMRRVRLALQGEMTRVQPLAIADATGAESLRARPAQADPRLRVLSTDLTRVMERMRSSGNMDAQATLIDRLIVMDFGGRAILIYPPAADMDGVLKDLQRLLKASKTN